MAKQTRIFSKAGRTLPAGILPEHRRTFRLLWLAFFVIGMAWGFTVPLFPVVIVGAGLPVHTYGLLQSYAALGSMLAQTLLGPFPTAWAAANRYFWRVSLWRRRS